MQLLLPGGLQVTPVQALLAVGIVAYAFAMPGDMDYKLDALGFGVCHQIHSHSFTIAGHQMPLCARCTGMYLGAIAALVLLAVMRRRATRFPAAKMVAIFGLFFGAMVLDGANSTLEAFGERFWDSTNLLRILTGSLAGVSAAFLFYPVFNMSLWKHDAASPARVIEQPRQLIGYMLVAGMLVVLTLSEGDWLYYPLSFLSLLGMVTLLTMANTILLLILTRRESSAGTFSVVLTPIMVGLFLTLIELTLLSWGRASLAPYMANNTGIPLVPGLP